MPTATVVRLEELRARREQRLRRTLALHRTDTERCQLVEHLAGVARLLGSDRVGAVWIDEYGPGLVHPHTVLDLLSENPRRVFAAEPLRMAWNDGVPGKVDIPDLERSGPIPIRDAARSLCAIAVGSDGAKAWFLIADGLSTRLPLDQETSGLLMFLAGECAGVLLHRDLTPEERGVSKQRFAGWPILRDIEGREDDEATSRKIGGRFLIARQLRALVDDDFVLDDAALAQQLQAVERELTGVPCEDGERALWEDILGALGRGDWKDLAEATVALAGNVEDQGHLHGAREFYGLAHRAAVVAGAPTEAIESARLLGRLHRNRGDWDEAIRWYGGARAVAQAEGDRTLEAVVLDGLATAFRDKGNLPAARELLHEGLQAAKDSSDDYALASIHHTLMSVERLSGCLAQAVAHGWRAVSLHHDEQDRYSALVSLAGCFVQMGELDAAEDSYTIVAERMTRRKWQLAAFEMLAHISALRGDRREFEQRIARVDRTDWREAASTLVCAQIYQYHGLSRQALGELEAARTWLTRARDYAQEHGVNQVYFECESALEGLERAGVTPNDAPSNAPSRLAPEDSDPLAAELAEIRDQVGALRRELAPV